MKNLCQKIFGKLISGIILTTIFLSGCTKDPFYTPVSTQEEMEKAIDGGFDGMIVYVNQAGKSSFYSAGFNKREDQTLADSHSLFKIASISKLYIAAATAKLVADDSLSLSQTLSELIPEVEEKIANADQITLKMLLQHRSGIPEYIYESGFDSEKLIQQCIENINTLTIDKITYRIDQYSIEMSERKGISGE